MPSLSVSEADEVCESVTLLFPEMPIVSVCAPPSDQLPETIWIPPTDTSAPKVMSFTDTPSGNLATLPSTHTPLSQFASVLFHVAETAPVHVYVSAIAEMATTAAQIVSSLDIAPHLR